MCRSSASIKLAAISLATALSLVGCTSNTTSSESGSLELTLELADGVMINEVEWTITGGEMEPMSGVINTSAPGATASVEVFGIPAGEGYLIELAATDESGEVTCRGDAEFDVAVGVATDVMVFLKCKRPTTLGGVRANGKFNICAQLTKVVVSPLQTSVGNDIVLSAQAVDAEEDPIAYRWTATGGTLGDATAAQTTYTCGEAGDQSITIEVSDDEFDHCVDSWTVSVTCVDGDGGTGGAGGAAGTGGGTGGVGGVGGAGGVGGEGGLGGTGGAGGEGGIGGAGGVGGEGGLGGTGGAGGGVDLCQGVTCEDTECTDGECDPGTGQCVDNPINEGGACESDTGTCADGVCVDNCEGVVCEEIECNVNACNPFTGECQAEPVADGTECDGGTCNAGVCEPALVCKYEQDFEGLDPEGPNALADDGWLFFGNVFDENGGFKFGFGPFPAPTTSGQVSGIATGEGGPEQGDKQLVVFSDYNCCQPDEGHFGTDMVETIVFQEVNSIPADFIGQVFTFEFDAKRGNIEGSTTAQAFIRTLDPDAGFATTNNVVLDTTNLPTDWQTYQVTIDLSDPLLEGQILQFGFSTVASNFEGAGNFYDNISFCTSDG